MTVGAGDRGRLGTPGNDRSPNRTLEKGLQLLNLFDVEHPEWSLRELRETSGFSKTTTLRLVKTLEAMEYLACDPNTGRYYLGSSMLRHAYVGLSRSELARTAHPFMDQLAKETTETAGLTVWTNQGPLLVDLVLTARMFKPNLRLGMLLPGRGGAAERVHLAFGRESAREAILSGPQKARTAYTLVDPKLLREELQRVRREGVSFELREWDVSMGAVAAPVFGADGLIRAVLAVVVPIERCGEEEMAAYKQSVRRTAHALSQEIGYQGDPPGSPLN